MDRALVAKPSNMTNKELLGYIAEYLNDKGIAMDSLDADQFMIDMITKNSIRVSEAQLSKVIEDYYIRLHEASAQMEQQGYDDIEDSKHYRC